jgi:small-conductance mechanosensitive channel
MPAVAVAFTLGIFIWVIRRALPDEPDTRMLRQLCIVGAVLLSNIFLVLVLPLDGETRGQLLSLLGLVLTAIIALSSTTFVSNAMAGVMLRAVGGFHPGDFISVADHFGRVTERGLLHTEIQSEDRDLMTLPNLFLITHPVKVVRRSGTLISAEVSLGYEIPRKKVRDLLKAAAEEAGLSDPFLQIRALQDHAVAYRIYGLLEDVSSLVTKRSELYAMVLDHLHGGDVEIVSPSFVNQRRPDPAQRRLPEPTVTTSADEDADQPERIMFDKAEVAARLNELREQRDTLAEEIKSLGQQVGDSASEREIVWREQQIAALEKFIATLEKD